MVVGCGSDGRVNDLANFGDLVSLTGLLSCFWLMGSEGLFLDVLNVIIDPILIILNNPILLVALLTSVPRHDGSDDVRVFALVKRVQEVGLAIDG